MKDVYILSVESSCDETSMAVVKNGNQLGLGFKKASEIKDTIDAFLTVMNKDITNEEVYR